jgi:hypothetical protein
MRISVMVSDKTVVIDGVGLYCPTLVAPDDWAWAYHWDDEIGGVIEPKYWLGRDGEHFMDGARMTWAVEAWDDALPKEPTQGGPV